MGWGPKAPKMDGLNEAAKMQAEIARETWNDYKTTIAPRVLNQMDEAIRIGREEHELNRENQEFQTGLSRKYSDRYFNTQIPLEDDIIADAKSFDTQVERERMAGVARGDVAQAFGLQRGQMRRNLGRAGVNPADGKFAMMEQRMAGDEALATALAANKTREAARQMGWARKADAAALGRGLPGFTGGASQLAMGFSGAGLQGAGFGMQAIGSAGNIQNQYASGAGNNFKGAADSYSKIADIQMRAKESGMEMLGTMAGSAAGAFAASDRRLKTDITRIGTLPNGIPLYRYRFKNSREFTFGVMADEVERILPQAVLKRFDGVHDAVNYSMLGG